VVNTLPTIVCNQNYINHIIIELYYKYFKTALVKSAHFENIIRYTVCWGVNTRQSKERNYCRTYTFPQESDWIFMILKYPFIVSYLHKILSQFHTIFMERVYLCVIDRVDEYRGYVRNVLTGPI